MGSFASDSLLGRQIRVVLVEPREGANVGAVCRAMKTMGLHSLTIVGAGGLDLEKARVLAVHAADVLEAAARCDHVQEAVRDAALVAGVTRRIGSRRKAWSLTPEALADRIAAMGRGTVALVFGNEEAGLSDAELALCHLAVHIPASPQFPSLNLSHAVQVIAYALFRRLAKAPPPAAAAVPIPDEELSRLVEVIIGSLRNIGYMTQPGSRGLGSFWRDILARAQLSAREARRLEGVFRNISGILSRRAVEKRPDGPGAGRPRSA